MNFEPDQVYHVYNRGNQKQRTFFKDADYILFIEKIREHIRPYADILAWCLMPNHFHLLIYAKENGCSFRQSGSNVVQELSYRIGLLLSNYTRILNRRNEWSGSVFQKKTKAKKVSAQRYVVTCMHYIHQNPLVANLIQTKLEDWKYSSFRDYAGLRNGTLCNQRLLFKLTDYDLDTFVKDSYLVINEDDVKLLY